MEKTNLKTNKSELVKVANSYAINAVKEYNLCNDRKIDVDGLFDGLTCGQLESMITLFECMTHLEYEKNKKIGIINRSYELAQKISDFYYDAKRKDNFKFVVLDILDFVDYKFNDAMGVMEQLNVENISMERLKFFAYCLYQSYQGKKEWYRIRNYAEQMMNKHNIMFDEQVVVSMKIAVKNNINPDDYEFSTVEYNFLNNSYKLNNNTNPMHYYQLPNGEKIMNQNVIFGVEDLMNKTEKELVYKFYIKIYELNDNNLEDLFNAYNNSL